MAEMQAARVDDEIAHTASKGWMIAGLIGGAVVGALAVVATGGVGLIAVSSIAAAACAGGGMGELLGSMSWAPRHVTGKLGDGSPNVWINSRQAIRAHLSTGKCEEHSGSPQRVAEGSIKVYINNWPAARKGDLLTCSAEIHQGSANVLIGGEKAQTDEISPEIPAWVNWTMLAVGAGAMAVLAGPVVALTATAGGMLGGTGGNWLGGEIFGEGSDGQKWSMFIGSLVGGGLGAKGGMKYQAWRATPKPLINIRKISPKLATEPDTAFFWSGRSKGMGGPDVAEGIARSRGGVTLESTIKDKNIKMPEWDFDNPQSIKAWEDVSAAYAKQVSGEIRAVVGEELRPGNIWENVELPRLMANEKVTKITTIDPYSQAETVIFQRGN
ncbi:PAAR domain-containing protein [Phytobacter massiliensis]|uniref:PAAR domain-containing protein n=1 Tax=Phytobacter massiliensis TaxID=1485952 RepID=UPI0002EA2E68|nr:PAAR domain-containing protein [Phytobacter massiliensis]